MQKEKSVGGVTTILRDGKTEKEEKRRGTSERRNKEGKKQQTASLTSRNAEANVNQTIHLCVPIENGELDADI